MSFEAALLETFDTKSTLMACRRLVEHVFPECRATGQRDLDLLVLRSGVSIKTTSDTSFEGKFERHGDSSSITLSAMGNRRRRRFTLAHELGHWMLRTQLKRNGDSDSAFRGRRTESTAMREEEKFANLIAAELLMPYAQVTRCCREMKFSFAFIAKIAKDFDVSFRAALKRIADSVRTPFLLMNVLPQRFNDLSSPAYIDDVWIFQPLKSVERDRNTFKFLSAYRYDMIQQRRLSGLGIIAGRFKFVTPFETRSMSRPIPNCDVLAMVSPSNVSGAA